MKNKFKNWVAAAKQGDREAFGHLYAATYNRIYFYLLNMLNNPQDAEDLTQIVFIHALEKLDQLEDDAAFYPWLICIAYSQCVNYIKSNWRQSPEELMEAEIEDGTVANRPDFSFLNNERRQILMTAILSLPPKHQSVILFKYYDNLKIKEIAFIMECSEGTIKSRLNAAKSSLNFLLKNQGIHSSFWGITPTLSTAAVSASIPLNTANNLIEEVADMGSWSFDVKAVGAAMAPFIVAVNTVDSEQLIITNYSGDEDLPTVQLMDSQSGVDPELIYALTESGVHFTPQIANETEATFKMPQEPCTLYYSNNAGNLVHAIVKSKSIPKTLETPPL